ncbi:hypothetical protein PENSPDRAFT_747991 [Peniophora sp. CONT]|nr:hypothetical protein PENSPDRAFT_747991 [Peniophora sp. CONT]
MKGIDTSPINIQTLAALDGGVTSTVSELSSKEYWTDVARQRLGLIDASTRSADASVTLAAVLSELHGLRSASSLLQRTLGTRQRLSTASPSPVDDIFDGIVDVPRVSEYWKLAVRTRLALSTAGVQLLEEVMAVDQAIARRELDGMAYASSLVRETRNAICSPFQVLPDETLMNIFEHCARDADPSSEVSNYAFQRLVFTFVCHRWRSVALDTPSCWTDIRDFNPHLVDIFLKRSKAEPLSVHCFGQPNESAMSHLWRVKHLTLLLSRTRNFEHYRYAGFVGRSAPMLKSLCATQGNGQRLAETFLLSVPLLREMKISGFLLNWTAFHWENLRSLDLALYTHSDARLWDPPGDFINLIENLRNTRCLQKLALREYIPFPSIPEPNSIRPVHLSSLRELQLSDESLRCVTVLSLLRIPSAATLDLRLRGGSEELMRKFLLSLDHCVQKETNRTQPLTTLIFQGDRMRLWSHDGPSPMQVLNVHDVASMKGGSPTVSIQLTTTSPYPEFDALFLCTFPFDHLVSVSIEPPNDNLDYELHSFWKEFLTGAVRLTHLRLVGLPVYGFLRALHHASRTRVPDNSGNASTTHITTPLPALSDLLLGKFDMRNTSFGVPLYTMLPDCVARLGYEKLDVIWLLGITYKTQWIDALRPHTNGVLLPFSHRIEA